MNKTISQFAAQTQAQRMADQVSAACPQTTTPQVAEWLSRTATMADSLLQRTQSLEGMLQPHVLRPDSPTDKNCVGPAELYLVGVADQLRTITRVLEATERCLTSIHDRLEL